MLGNERINKTNCVKYLGVMLDDKFNLKTHVDYVKSRAIRRLSILKCIAGKGNGADRTILIRIPIQISYSPNPRIRGGHTRRAR